MLVPNFSVVKLARKAAYRADGDLMAAGSRKPVKLSARTAKKAACAGSSAKAKVVRISKEA
jgi:polyisoprenoid-binding protein YceI